MGLAACGSESTDQGTVKKSASTPTAPDYLQAVSYDALPGWADGKQAWVLGAWRKSCARLGALTETRRRDSPSTQDKAGSARRWQAACQAISGVPSGDHRAAARYFERWFQPYRARGKGQFTGYYEAEIRASLTRKGRYIYPIYGMPSALVTIRDAQGRARRVLRYNGKTSAAPTRREIDKGTISRRWPVLMWGDDPVDIFMLHIQGSARVRLPGGQQARVGYAGDNGHRFVGIGRVMQQQGLLKKTGGDMRAIRRWLKKNPRQARVLMAKNPRYIFFRTLPAGRDGPLGAAGVSLTAGRSLAVDPRYVPYHTPLWLVTSWPGGKQPLRRLIIAQDTGNAIRGPVRGDLYWGTGEAALRFAGGMNQKGSFFLLLPREKPKD